MNDNETTKATQEDTTVNNDTSVNNLASLLDTFANDFLVTSNEVLETRETRRKKRQWFLDNCAIYPMRHKMTLVVNRTQGSNGFRYALYKGDETIYTRYALHTPSGFICANANLDPLTGSSESKQLPNMRKTVTLMDNDPTLEIGYNSDSKNQTWSNGHYRAMTKATKPVVESSPVKASVKGFTS
jgi:hypothetical protein